jgi:hypothetical protein
MVEAGEYIDLRFTPAKHYTIKVIAIKNIPGMVEDQVEISAQ